MTANFPLVKILLDRIDSEFDKSDPDWEFSSITDDDYSFLEKECNTPSKFDPYNRRKFMYTKMKEGEFITCIKECKYGKVFCILENERQEKEIPWGLWGRILRIYTDITQEPFRIFFLADKTLREFPEKGSIQPEHINGGYTYPCNKTSIMIYRAEDATRVLLHELMHSCCADKMENGVDMVEAETEAWAELLYIVLLAQGKKFIINALLQRQSEYMKKQNEIVRKYIGNTMQFPWRYTIGKENVWKRWGIFVEHDEKPLVQVKKSLRLTYPPNNMLKERFGVLKSSTIL